MTGFKKVRYPPDRVFQVQQKGIKSNECRDVELQIENAELIWVLAVIEHV